MSKEVKPHQIPIESLDGADTPQWAAERARKTVTDRTTGHDRDTILAMLGLDQENQ